MFNWLVLLILVLIGTSADTLGSKISDNSEDYISYRLPNNTIPQHYSVWLRTWVDESKFDFQGRVTIRLIPLEANTRYITIHKMELKIASNITLVRVSVNPIEIIPIDHFNYTEQTDFLTIPIKNQEGLILGQIYELTIDFSGNLRTYMNGLYRAFYNIGNRTIWYATTQFEPTDARRAFPCYDEPAKRATFNISITHSSTYNAISNMPVKEIIPFPNSNHVTTVFDTTVRMSTYQLAFVVSDYVYREDTRPRVNQRIYAHKSLINDTTFGLEAGVKILEALEKYLDFPYPLPKMDQIGITQFPAGAMENWGLVTYKEHLLYFNPKTSTQRNRVVISSIIGHEFGHQWFGNLITPKWWSYLWLNEGFATLYQWEAPQMAYPEDRYGELFTIEALQDEFEKDGTLKRNRPMTDYKEDQNGVESLFDHIAYEKSASVLRMMKHFLTEKIWKDGLKRYFAAKQFDAAEPDDLFASFDAAVSASKLTYLPKGVTVKTIMDSWHLQEGYPLVQINRVYGGSNIFTARQRRFLKYQKDQKNHKINSTWWVPMSLASRDRPDQYNTAPNFWLPQGTVEANFSRPIEFSYTDADWILINKQQTGYFRVNYDEKNWKLLANELVNGDLSKIHLSSRAQLLDDSLDLARHDFIDLYYAFSILNYLRRETEYVPWAAAQENILWFRRYIINSDTTGRFRYFLRDISNAIYAKYGIKSVPCEPFMNKQARTLGIRWACASGNTACRSAATAELRKALTTGQDIEQDYHTLMYCAGMRDANRDLFDIIWAKFKKTDDRDTRRFYIDALSCSENAAVLRYFIKEIFVKGLFFRDELERVIYRVAQFSTAGLAAILDHIVTNTEEIIANHNGYMVGQKLTILSHFITTPAEVEIFKKISATMGDRFIKQHKIYAEIVIKRNLKWVAKHSASVNKFLTEVYGDTIPTLEPSPEPTTTAAPGGGGQVLTTSIILLAITSSVHLWN